MEHLFNKLFFLLIGFSFSYLYGIELMSVLPFLLCIFIVSCTYIFPSPKFALCLQVSFCLLSFFEPTFVFYLSCVLYDAYVPKTWKNHYVLFLVAYAYAFLSAPSAYILFSIVFGAMAMIFKIFTSDALDLQVAYLRQRDAMKEVSILLEEKNKELLLTQEYEVKIATLDERNRIAREIHDNVGHLLSSSLLQIGALQAINLDESLNIPLQSLRETISEGMDNVRSSVHNLHDDAIELEHGLRKLLDEFTFIKTSFEYDVISPPPQTYCFHILAIVKESLTNTMKHSNANIFELFVREQPYFYQLIIHDNGTSFKKNTTGIGLKNIQERVENFHGYVNISTDDGFQLFITLPKERS